MHSFAELIARCVTYTLHDLNKTTESIVTELQTSSATTLVKALQMVRLQKAVMAVGMFSIFEAILQDQLGCRDGFAEVKSILENSQDTILLRRFVDYYSAINVLKHGRGRSYHYLVARCEELDFRVKLPEQNLFDEGDVSEVTILVDVDDKFMTGCARVIEDVAKAVRTARPGTFI